MKLFFWIDSAKTSIFGKSFIYLNQVFVDLKSQKSITICGQNMEIPDIVGGCLHNETSEPALLTAAPSTWNCQARGAQWLEPAQVWQAGNYTMEPNSIWGCIRICISMTQLLSHTFAHLTGPNSDFQSQFSTSKIIRIFLICFS